jgi:predicted TPR repeat methyltransferase
MAPTKTTSLSVADAIEVALAMHKAGMLDAAAEIYDRVLQAAPRQADALHFLGLLRYQRGERDEGIELVRRALAEAPDHADARNNLGNMLLERGRLDEAEQAYRRVLELRAEHADAHTNLGVVLQRRGDLAAAEASFRRAVALDPKHGEAYHDLGGVLVEQDRHEEALDAFRKALGLRPYDGNAYRRIGAALYALRRLDEATAVYRSWVALEPNNPSARHMLAACTGEAVPERADDSYVQKTFDTFAASFDSVLGRLQYRAPQLVMDAVAGAVGAPAAALDVLDAGAGTGWCGPLLRPYARRLVGVDLSSGMLAHAKDRACYDDLAVAELTAYMREHAGAFDLVVSADTLVYFGELGEAMAAAAAALRPGGHLAFTVERLDGPGTFRLCPHGRYAHTEAYVREALAAAGLTTLSIDPAHLRLEALVPVEGLLVLARRA